MKPTIYITNQSTVLKDDDVTKVIPSLQKQVSNDFCKYWQIDAILEFLAKDAPLPADGWQIVIVDDPDQAGALGYHELSSQGTPLGKVFAKLDLQAGTSWTVTISHELLEMLADPWINWIAQGADGKLYALEVSDPVESDEYGYQIDGVLVSDFVTPSWYEPTSAKQYDFMGKLNGPFTMLPGGYVSVYDANGWQQVTARKDVVGVHEAKPQYMASPTGSRRHRRTYPKSSWHKSTV